MGAKVTNDGRMGWGPDELIVKRMIPGTYSLYVHKLGDEMTSFEESDAKVSVYQNDQLIDVIVAPTMGDSMTKKFWNVLSFDGQDPREARASGSSFDDRKIISEVVR